MAKNSTSQPKKSPAPGSVKISDLKGQPPIADTVYAAVQKRLGR